MRDIFIMYMKTTILITEQQKRRLIIESLNDEVNDNVTENVSLFKKIAEFSSDEFSNNLGFLITWGAGIGGFMGPVEDFVRGNYPEINESELVLISIGFIATYFIENKSRSNLFAQFRTLQNIRLLCV